MDNLGGAAMAGYQFDGREVLTGVEFRLRPMSELLFFQSLREKHKNREGALRQPLGGFALIED